MGIYLTYKERYKAPPQKKIHEIETIIEKEVNILHWWQKVLMWMGAIFSLIFIVKLYIK